MKTKHTDIMIENFMKYHNEGKTISEISEICNVSIWTIYSNLEIISKRNNVTRESLLTRVHKQHELKNVKIVDNTKHLNDKEFIIALEELSKNVSNVIEKISIILTKEQ